jgi:hypothetical protein
MATIREWLNDAGFHWEGGTIVIQEEVREEDDWRPSPGWCTPNTARKVASPEDPILDLAFPSGFGGPECPRFFAKDSDAVYFPGQYDGSTWCEKVFLDPDRYLDPEVETPYPGS